MKSTSLQTLPPAYSERMISLARQQFQLSTEVHLSFLPSHPSSQSNNLFIENYYCKQQNGKLVKITYIRIGKQLIKLTDRFSVRRQQSEEDNKTKNNSISTQISNYPIQQKRNYLCRSSKRVLDLFEKWLHRNYSESGLLLRQIKSIYKSESELVTAITHNQQLRQHFLVYDQDRTDKFRKRELRVLRRWTYQCHLAKDQQEKRQNSIDEMLQQQNAKC